MGSEWTPKTLSEIAIISSMKITPIAIDESKYVSTDNMITNLGGIIGLSKLPSTGKITAFEKGDVLFSNIRTYFKKVWLADKNGGCSNDVLVFRPQPKIPSEYLYYILSSDDFINYTVQTSKGTKMPRGDKHAMMKYGLSLPPTSQRNHIGCALKVFDNKIQLNRQTNQTLEQMAQALFKSWFVDFDPVIDNALAAGNPIPDALQERAERRQQQLAKPDHKPLPDDIRQLFPSEFELTEELGWVPKGWVVSSIGKAIVTVGGGTPKTQEDAYWADGMYAFCTPKDMSNMSSKILLKTGRHLTKVGVERISSKILPVGTVLMSSRAPIGYLAITNIPVSINQGIIALKQNEKYGSEYLLCWAEANMEEIISRANGSTFLEISKNNFRDIAFLESQEDVLSTFTNIASNYFDRIVGLQCEIDQLTNLRDTLLPKLISGELRLPTNTTEQARNSN